MELIERQPVQLSADVLQVRQMVGLSNMYRHRYRMDFTATIGRILSVKNVDEKPSRADLVVSRRRNGAIEGNQRLYRLSGGLVRCKDALTDEVVYADLETFLIPEDAIDPLLFAGPAPCDPPVPGN